MTTVYDVPHTLLISRVAEILKTVEALSPPTWYLQVKTGVAKENSPQNPDWWYLRAASILRKLYLRGPIGLERLAALYSDKRRRGRSPPHSMKASRKIIRTILQQLEAAGLVEKQGNRGRILSSRGRSLLDKVAYEISRKYPLPEIGRYYTS